METLSPFKQNTRKLPRPVIYPGGDGKPMAETEQHINNMVYAIACLPGFYAGRDAYAMGNNFIYYEEGNPQARVSPDTYVVLGVPPKARETYFTWKEGGKGPDIVFEFTSRATRREDLEYKRDLYQNVLHVSEYILFDPHKTNPKARGRKFLPPAPLMGLRLVDGVYEEIPVENGRLHSEVLGLDIVVVGTEIRFFDPVRGAFLGDYLENIHRIEEEVERAIEMERRLRRETQRAAELQSRAQAAEAEVERLKAALAASQANPSAEKAEKATS